MGLKLLLKPPLADVIAIVKSPYRYGVELTLHTHDEEALCFRVVSYALRMRFLSALGLYLEVVLLCG